MKPKLHYVAFHGSKQIASGDLHDVVAKAHKAANGHLSGVMIFDDATGDVMDIDLSGSAREVMRRLDETAPAASEAEVEEPRKPGRPKLGVVAREVTLLPRHWEWLNLQPGGASVALRRLVEEARRVHRNTDRIRQAKEAAYRFMSVMAGNESGFEEAIRGLFAGDAVRFAQFSRTWPVDVSDYSARLAARAFPEGKNS